MAALKPRRGGTRALLAVAVAALCAPPVVTAGAAPTEYQVKAVYLYNFTNFVEWPAAAFAEPGGPFAICVLGTNPFGTVLDEVLAGEAVEGRRLVTRRVHEPSEATGCQIVFVSAASAARVPTILQRLAGRPVLTVGEDADFASAGGMVRFREEEGTVRFDVNPEALERAGLKMNAYLLGLARVVETAR